MPILAAFQQGRQAAVPLIIGSNSDDSSVALAFGLKPEAIVKQLGAARILVGPMYPGVVEDAELGRQVVRDVAFTAFARRIAYLQSAKAPTWRYYYSHVMEQARGQQPGAAHGAEMPAVFGTGERCGCLAAVPTAQDRALWAHVEERWAAFAREGEPQAVGAPAWPRDARLRQTVLGFGQTEQVQPEFMRDRLNAFIGVLNLAGRRSEKSQ